MTAERRTAANRGIDLPVYIRYHKRPFRGAHARDLSAGGMFLEVQALTLPSGTPIELEFRGLGQRWVLPAVVTHGDRNGIGVRFRDPQPTLFRDLHAPSADTLIAAAPH